MRLIPASSSLPAGCSSAGHPVSNDKKEKSSVLISYFCIDYSEK